MTTMTMIQAITHTLDQALERDDKVLVFGEDVGPNGGVFRATDGLTAKHGEDRVFDTPLNENLIVGAAIGMAAYGMRPVPEIQFMDYIWPGYDQLVNEAAKLRYRSGGEYWCPMTVRTPYGGGIRGGHYHSQSGEGPMLYGSGLTIVAPSTAHDAKGLLHASIELDDPVIFMEPKALYRAAKGDVSEDYYTEELSKAVVRREGSDGTIVSYGSTMPMCLKAAEAAGEQGVDMEVIDLRTIMPWDKETVLESIRKTGRLITVCEAPMTGSMASEISATVAEEAVDSLEAPIARVAGYDIPFPYTLEGLYMPNANKIMNAIESVINY